MLALGRGVGAATARPGSQDRGHKGPACVHGAVWSCLVLGPPKSQAGRRTVSLPEIILLAVREHLTDYVDARPTRSRSPDRPAPRSAVGA
jgi:hypothetical protein